MLGRSLIFCLMVLSTVPGWSQDWKLRKNEDGIKVYTREVKSSSFNAFKATMTVEATVEDLVNVLKNMDDNYHIFPDTKKIEILDRPNDSTQIHYSLSDAPWPVDDRDGIYKLVFHENRKTGKVTVYSTAIPDYLPEVDGVVRIKQSSNTWVFTPKKNGKVKVLYEVQAEPGGAVPNWLANSMAVDIPFDTFVNLRKVLEK